MIYLENKELINKLKDESIDNMYSIKKKVLDRDSIYNAMILNSYKISSSDKERFKNINSYAKIAYFINKYNINNYLDEKYFLTNNEMEELNKDYYLLNFFASSIAHDIVGNNKLIKLFKRQEDSLYQYIDTFDKINKLRISKLRILEEEAYFKLMLLLIKDKETNTHSNLDEIFKIFNSNIYSKYQGASNLNIINITFDEYRDYSLSIRFHLNIAVYLSIKGIYKLTYSELYTINDFWKPINLLDHRVPYEEDSLKSLYSKKRFSNFKELIESLNKDFIKNNPILVEDFLELIRIIEIDIASFISNINLSFIEIGISIDTKEFNLVNEYILEIEESCGYKLKDEIKFLISIFIFTLISQEKYNNKIKDKVLNDDRNRFLDQNKLTKAEEEIIRLNSSIKDLKANNNSIVASKDHEIEMLKRELIAAKKEIIEKDKIILKRDEIIEIQTRILESQEEEETITPISSDKDYIELIKDYKIAILGGTEVWASKVSNIFPNFKVYSLEDINKDISGVKNCDYIFVNSVNSHKFYYKIINELKKYRVDHWLLKANTNINKFSEQIYNIISNK